MSPALRDGPQLIVAVGRDGAIGRAGDLPWQAPEDLAHFRRTTDGHALVLGRVTWESIGRPLPGRRIVVVAGRRPDLPPEVTWAPTPDAALDHALAIDTSPFVGGGAAIYAALLPRAVTVHRTLVEVEVPDADTWFPALDAADWTLVESRSGDDPRLTFERHDRRR
ncbi:MAG: dihydrofolate reductase [Acidimicrobiales bacterium]|nr:dihydrofolate reductase [Acidimicrobiales bacterium]